MPFGAYVAFAVKELFPAIDAFPREISEEVHEAVTERFGSRQPAC
jgi:hypothetical protein